MKTKNECPIVLSPAAFIRVVGSEFVQKYLGEGPRMVRDVFRLAKENAPAIIFIDEIDAIATKRFDAQTGGMNMCGSHEYSVYRPMFCCTFYFVSTCYCFSHWCLDSYFRICSNSLITSLLKQKHDGWQLFSDLECFAVQLTGRCRESFWSCWIKWTALTRTSMSRWAKATCL